MILKTNYKDFVSPTGELKYNERLNPDGTKTFIDVTEYEQIGDTYGATDINKTNEAINELNKKIGDQVTFEYEPLSKTLNIVAK